MAAIRYIRWHEKYPGDDPVGEAKLPDIELKRCKLPLGQIRIIQCMIPGESKAILLNF